MATVAGLFSPVKVYSLGLQVYVVYNREVPDVYFLSVSRGIIGGPITK
jgi:hypothetical protein